MIKKLKDILNSYSEEDLERVRLYVDAGKEVDFLILDDNDDIILVTEDTPVSVAGHNLEE